MLSPAAAWRSTVLAFIAASPYPARMSDHSPPQFDDADPLDADVMPTIAGRFRGFLPVVVDVETAGFDARRHALLEIAAVIIRMDARGRLLPGQTIACHVLPFIGAELDQRALAFNKIDPAHPFRDAIPEHEALQRVLTPVRKAVGSQGCTRAILVGHNAHFDLGFLKAAVERTGFKRDPFHAFSVFDTVSLAGLAYGQTVLAKAVKAAGVGWNDGEAHSAIYDAEKTAALFCSIVNQWQALSAAPPGVDRPASGAQSA
jgi:ribonuclease T